MLCEISTFLLDTKMVGPALSTRSRLSSGRIKLYTRGDLSHVLREGHCKNNNRWVYVGTIWRIFIRVIICNIIITHTLRLHSCTCLINACYNVYCTYDSSARTRILYLYIVCGALRPGLTDFGSHDVRDKVYGCEISSIPQNKPINVVYFINASVNIPHIKL